MFDVSSLSLNLAGMTGHDAWGRPDPPSDAFSSPPSTSFVFEPIKTPPPLGMDNWGRSLGYEYKENFGITTSNPFEYKPLEYKPLGFEHSPFGSNPLERSNPLDHKNLFDFKPFESKYDYLFDKPKTFGYKPIGFENRNSFESKYDYLFEKPKPKYLDFDPLPSASQGFRSLMKSFDPPKKAFGFHPLKTYGWFSTDGATHDTFQVDLLGNLSDYHTSTYLSGGKKKKWWEE